MAQISQIKVQPPRKLELKETQQSLAQWKMQFRMYMKQGEANRKFLASDTAWNPNAVNYGFAAEAAGLERSAAALKDDCRDFLYTLATFLPHGYLTDKLVTTSTSFETAFEILEEHYGLKATQESFLELESFQKQSGESYRQFFERLMAHVRKHLITTPGVAVDGATVAAGGDRLTVSHMNQVTLMWLRKIHPEMINIVRTEYSLELRNNTAVSSLVPRIAVNVDSLLAKYDKVGQVNLVQYDDDDDTKQASATIRKTFVKRQKAGGDRDPKTPFCPGCYSVNQKSKNKIHFKHLPAECPRKTYIKYLQTAYLEDDEDDNVDDLENLELDTGKISSSKATMSKTISKQETRSKLNEQSNVPADNQKSSFIVESFQDSELESIVRNVKIKIKEFRKEMSPSLNCIINSNNLVCIVDEGSQINCLSFSFAQKSKIPIVQSTCTAVGAGNSLIDVMGVTKHEIFAEVVGAKDKVRISLGRMVVIRNLGADALVGQPGKIDNKILTSPHTNSIQFEGCDGKKYKVSYPIRNDENINLHDVVKVSSSQTLYPGDSLVYKLPNQFSNQKKVLVTHKPTQVSWVQTQVLDIHDGCVSIPNDTKHSVYLKKHEHIADIKSVKQISVNKVLAPTENFEHLEQYEDWDFNEQFINDVTIDPDGTLTQSWRDKFRNLCLEYSDILNYRPSKYNGWYGEIDNSIDFSSSPPPTKKIHMPKYSDKMLQILAEKMDKLEKWEVLVPPEQVGVVPVFVCPSMLMPKENNEWRLVTDFTSLNKHIRKPPSLAPTIEETKLQMAKFKYLASLDLSNFYYQHGMKREDLQYLATQHPYKGLRIYKVEPQGLRGASEHAYERLKSCVRRSLSAGEDGETSGRIVCWRRYIGEFLCKFKRSFSKIEECRFHHQTFENSY